MHWSLRPLLIAGLAVGTLTAASSLSVRSQPTCPETSDSSYCRWKARFDALERARERIVSAARLAGSEEPSGLIVLLRNASGTLTLQKVNVELPESVDARLNGYLTPLVMEHMGDPPESMILELRPADTRGRPHPDSASRDPEVRNVESLRARLDSMADMLSELPLQNREPLQGRDTIRLLYEALVDSHGRVRHVEVHESSGVAWVDDYFAQLIPRLEVAPRVKYGIRLASRLLQPLELVVR